MPKRTLWARQPKHERRELVKRFQFFPMSKGVEQANEFLRLGKGLARVARQTKIDFLLRNKALTIEVFKTVAKEKGHKLSTAHLNQKLNYDLGSLPSSGLDNIVARLVDKILADERTKLQGKSYFNVQEYLKGRGFRTEADALNNALADYFENRKLTIGQAINLQEIEKLYILNRKKLSGRDQTIAFHVKSLAAEIVSGLRLTDAQRKRAKRVVSSRIEPFLEELHKSYNNMAGKTPKERTEFVKQSVKSFTQGIREELLKEFTQKAKPIVVAKTQSVNIKPGTRRERMAAYIPGEKSSQQRQTDLNVQKNVSQRSKKLFDSVAYSISEIRKENPEVADSFSKLLRERRLSRGSMVNLYISGSLAQKIFLKAINESNFAAEFGNKSIESLARGVSFIESQGRTISRAVRAFQSSKAQQMYDYLEKKDLLETYHTVRKVVYLKRG